MSSLYRDRYGIPGAEVSNLSKRLSVLHGKENWTDFDAFVKWCSENGYQKGIKLRRHDERKPHSPENSFFAENTREIIRINSEKFHEFRQNSSPFCTGCEKECQRNGSGGCDEWQAYFKNNWDQNIYIAPKKKEEPVEDPNITKFFRYEHPDLVREGIVFEGSGRM